MLPSKFRELFLAFHHRTSLSLRYRIFHIITNSRPLFLGGLSSQMIFKTSRCHQILIEPKLRIVQPSVGKFSFGESCSLGSLSSLKHQETGSLSEESLRKKSTWMEPSEISRRLQVIHLQSTLPAIPRDAPRGSIPIPNYRKSGDGSPGSRTQPSRPAYLEWL